MSQAGATNTLLSRNLDSLPSIVPPASVFANLFRLFVGFALFASLEFSAFAQGRMPGPENNFDAMMKGDGIMDLHTLEEVDRKLRNQAETRSEANLSKLDLKAPGRARREYSKGLAAFAKNDFKAASESLRTAISIYPEFVSAHNALGCAYFSLGQNQLALQEFQQATQFDDHLSNSFMNLGRIELALGQNANAQAAFEKALSISPLTPHISLALTYTQYLSHDYAGAIKTAQRAHAHPHTGIAAVHYFAAASWQAQKRFSETRVELETFLREDPNSPLADPARKTIAQIEQFETQPQEFAIASSAPTFSAENPATSLLGQRVLQEYKEKQQIAEAETGDPACSSCPPSEQPTPRSASREGTAEVRQPFTFRSSVDEVAVFFTVTDHGRSVTDLKSTEMSILDDKRPPATVVDFRTESHLPLRLALIIDTSESITDRLSFEQAAGTGFLHEVLTGKDDLAFVAGFSNSVVLVQDFTDDVAQLSHGMNQLVPVGGTAIWDAVAFAAEKLVEKPEPQPVARIIVVISDGDDNSSSATLKQAIEKAQRNEVAVYTVSTRYDDPERSDESTGNHAMKALAQTTGGVAFFPGSASHLKRSLADLQQVIRSRYLISYRPALFQRDGHYRTLDITAQRNGHKLKVNARKGYYAAVN
jgi:Ca-activated chloride channel family protein